MLSDDCYWSFDEYITGNPDGTPYGIRHLSKTDPDLVRLVKFIRQSFNVSACLLSHSSSDRAWFQATVGKGNSESVATHIVICGDIQGHHVMCKGIRFFASVRLFCRDEVVGTLCLLGTQPRTDFSDEDELNLRDCVDMVGRVIEPKVEAMAFNSLRQHAMISGRRDSETSTSSQMQSSLTPTSLSAPSFTESRTRSQSEGSTGTPSPEISSSDYAKSNSIRGCSSLEDDNFESTLVLSADPVTSARASTKRSGRVTAKSLSPIMVNTDGNGRSPTRSTLPMFSEAGTPVNGGASNGTPRLSFRYSISGNFAHQASSSVGSSGKSSVGSDKAAAREIDRFSSKDQSIDIRSWSGNELSRLDRRSFNSEDSDGEYICHRDHIKILLMEDSVLVQKILLRLFEQNGCEVKIAKNGKIGLEMLKSEYFDIAFVDFFMPIQDGVTTMKLFKDWLKEQRSKPDYTPGSVYNDEMVLVGISDIASDVDKSEARFNDMHIFCGKPLDPEMLQIILSARRNCDSFAEAVERIRTEIEKQEKSKTALVTRMAEEMIVGGNDKKDVAANATKKDDSSTQILKMKPAAKRTPQPKSWWRKISGFYSRSDDAEKEKNGGKGKTPKSPNTTEPHKGSTTSQQKRAPPMVNYQLHLGSAGDLNRIKVLLVDDSNLTLKIMTKVFRSNGCDVHTAVNGAIALDMLKKEEYDIAMIDFHMPVRDGLETMRLFCEWVSEERAWIEKGYATVNEKNTSRSSAKAAVRNENMLLVGMSDSITRSENEHVFDSNSMHFFCGKPVSVDLLLIILKAVKNYDIVDDMLIYIERNAAKLFMEKHKPVYNWARGDRVKVAPL